MTNKIKVELKEKSYEIFVGKGQIQQIGQFLASDSGKNYSTIFIISDENVAKLHLSKLEAAIGSDKKCEKIIIKSGEESKNFGNFAKVCEEILQKNADRKSLIIAFGGGVVGDLSGFVASVILRGIDFVQIPTTLLSMVDSSVGGKTAINCAAGKNMIGSFYQPKLVICDLDFLTSLPKREVLAGYAEIVKYGLIYDAVFFDFLSAHHENIFAFEEESLQRAIISSCQIKAEIVAQDEKEQGLRAILNFGHTFAHALEKELSYDGRLNHGEAVGIGMLMALEMSKNLGSLSEEDFLIAKNHLEKAGLNIDLKAIKTDWSKEKLIQNIYSDKKTLGGKLTFILITSIGHAEIKKGVFQEDFLLAIDRFI